MESKSNQEFAVKIFEKKKILESKQSNKSKIALLNEIDVMKQLDHPNMSNLYEIYEGATFIYLVTEFLKGG